MQACANVHRRPLVSTTRPVQHLKRLPRRPMAAPGPADAPASDVVAGEIKIKKGDTIPMDAQVYIYEDGADAPTAVPLKALLGGKKAVVFGLPGAYTSVCSSKHVPEYKTKKKLLDDQGVEVIACLSVNDAYVMKKWAEELGVDSKTLLMLGDPDCSFHKAVGLNQFIPGLGDRSRRYSMYLEDGVVKVLNVDEPGGKSYKVSGPSFMEASLKELHGKA
ncbi:Redoxin-domain-containing protein [Haematococcus lacustris]